MLDLFVLLDDPDIHLIEQNKTSVNLLSMYLFSRMGTGSLIQGLAKHHTVSKIFSHINIILSGICHPWHGCLVEAYFLFHKMEIITSQF